MESSARQGDGKGEGGLLKVVFRLRGHVRQYCALDLVEWLIEMGVDDARAVHVGGGTEDDVGWYDVRVDAKEGMEKLMDVVYDNR